MEERLAVFISSRSYRRWVGKCDLFILLLGEGVTDPVRMECERATQARKPRLFFLI
ncbi:MAG: hypothetical protein ACETWR_10435 [Anaerolineae bacterium]